MPDWLILILIVVAWIAIQRWVLPRFGVAT
jgi:hypothetical protein